MQISDRFWGFNMKPKIHHNRPYGFRVRNPNVEAPINHDWDFVRC